MRHNFLLIEVIISLMIIAICGTILLTFHIRMLDKETTFIIESQCYRLIQNTFLEIKKTFYLNNSPSLENPNIPLSDLKIQTVKNYDITIKRLASTSIERKNEKFYLLNINITLIPIFKNKSPKNKITKTYKLLVEVC